MPGKPTPKALVSLWSEVADGSHWHAFEAITATAASRSAPRVMATSVKSTIYCLGDFRGTAVYNGFVSVLIHSFREKRSLRQSILVANVTVIL
jgi:hypothetical protein